MLDLTEKRNFKFKLGDYVEVVPNWKDTIKHEDDAEYFLSPKDANKTYRYGHFYPANVEELKERMAKVFGVRGKISLITTTNNKVSSYYGVVFDNGVNIHLHGILLQPYSTRQDKLDAVLKDNKLISFKKYIQEEKIPVRVKPSNDMFMSTGKHISPDVLKNPDRKEVTEYIRLWADLMHEKISAVTLRGYLKPDGDIFVWLSNILHDDVSMEMKWRYKEIFSTSDDIMSVSFASKNGVFFELTDKGEMFLSSNYDRYMPYQEKDKALIDWIEKRITKYKWINGLQTNKHK
jgi:hypothetical protein